MNKTKDTSGKVQLDWEKFVEEYHATTKTEPRLLPEDRVKEYLEQELTKAYQEGLKDSANGVNPILEKKIKKLLYSKYQEGFKVAIQNAKEVIDYCSNEKLAPDTLAPVLGNKNAHIDGKWLEQQLDKLKESKEDNQSSKGDT